MEYVLVSHDDIENPNEEGLYEYDGDLNSYYLSTDVTVDANTNYYLELDEDDIGDDFSLYALIELEGTEVPVDELLYEYSDETGFFLTTDKRVDSSKDYYVYAGDEVDYSTDDGDLYYPADPDEEEIENPSALGLYEYDAGIYVETEDTVVDPEKQYFWYGGDDEEEELEEVVEDVVDESMLTPTMVFDQAPEVPYSDTESGYVLAFTNFVSNPSQYGYYEYNEETGQYVLTQDTENDGRKYYYVYVDLNDYRQITVPQGESPNAFEAYEETENGYALTQDETPVSGKAYYVYDPLFSDYVDYDDPDIPGNELPAGYGEPVAGEYEDD